MTPRAWLIVLAAAFLGGGCATGRSPRTFHDPSFTGTTACEGGNAVVGVVSLGRPVWIGRATGSAEKSEEGIIPNVKVRRYPDPPGWFEMAPGACERFVKDLFRDSR